MNDNLEEKKLNNLYNDGLRCIKDHRYNNSIRIFTNLLKIKPEYCEAKVYAYRAQAFFALKLYVKALKDAQKALLLDPKNPYAYWLNSRIMWEISNKPAAISIIQSGLLNSDSTSSNYNSLNELLDLYTNRILTEKKKFDPLLDTPLEIAFLIISRLSIPERMKLNRVCKSWKKLINSSQILWDNVNFLQKNTSTLFPRTFFINNTLNPNVNFKAYTEKFYEMSTSENISANCFKNNCYSLYFYNNHRYYHRDFTEPAIPEKNVLGALKNASSQLASIIIPDSRNLGSDFISALTSKSHSKISTFCISRLPKFVSNYQILPLFKTFLQTNHLTKLCFSYNSLITSQIVYNIGIQCTNLKILDLSCTPNVDWRIAFTQTTELQNKELFKELEELYVENQLNNYILISNDMSQLDINFKKLTTLSLSWNIHKFRIMGFNSINPFTQAKYSTIMSFQVNFAAFPNLAHVYLDGLFEIYKPVFSLGITHTDVVPDNTYIPNFCLFACATSNNLSNNISNNFFISILQHSKKIKCLNLAKSRNLQDSFIESFLQFSLFLTVLNLTGCKNLSAFAINLLIEQCSQHLEILELASTNSDYSTQLTIAEFMTKYIKKINLDRTLSTGNGLLAISKAIKNMYFICNKPNSKFSDYKNCYNCLESIQAYQKNKMKELDMLNFGKRAYKRKFSELEKSNAYNTQIFSCKKPDQSDYIKRSNILISVKFCNSISYEAVNNCREKLKDTCAKILFQY
ncbi:hypothetical protein BB561_006599 [Smittium simulii]|uniref:F-box domain-containing protein n=1 Tax=Smittium simulii TaxID=133385 RepID=A0A2T9Y2Y9_9FUNG|nr:hypothetical protein BB561_006599 [Smittium simulii]